MPRKLDVLPPAGVNREPYPGWTPWVYLASGLGFSASVRELVTPKLVAALEMAGAKVFEPFNDNNEGASNAAEQSAYWAYRIGQSDVEAVRRCDAVFCCANGNPPDEGAMVEIGIAIGLRKPVFVFRDDYRTCAKTEAYPLNLMVFTAMPEDGWQAYYYTSMDEIADPQKAFAKWIAGADVRPASLRGSDTHDGSTSNAKRAREP